MGVLLQKLRNIRWDGLNARIIKREILMEFRFLKNSLELNHVKTDEAMVVNTNKTVKFEVLIAATNKITVFCFMTP
jgi:hypothetical protein